VFIEAKDDGGGGDNWTTGTISCAKLQSNHQQLNNQFFTDRMPFLSPNQQCQSTEGKTPMRVFGQNCSCAPIKVTSVLVHMGVSDVKFRHYSMHMKYHEGYFSLGHLRVTRLNLELLLVISKICYIC